MLELTTTAITVEMDETNLGVGFVGQIVITINSLYFFQTKSRQHLDKEQSANIQEDTVDSPAPIIAARLPSLDASTADVSRPYDWPIFASGS